MRLTVLALPEKKKKKRNRATRGYDLIIAVPTVQSRFACQVLSVGQREDGCKVSLVIWEVTTQVSGQREDGCKVSLVTWEVTTQVSEQREDGCKVSLVTWEVTTQVSGNYKDKLNLSNSRQNFTKFEHSYGRNSISKVRSGNTTPPPCQAPMVMIPPG